MMRWLLVCCTLAMAITPAGAIVLRSDKDVVIPKGEVIDDDLAVTGGNITIAGKVTHDLLVAGGTVAVSGPVGGDLIVAGGDVTVNAPVGGSVYAAAGTLVTNDMTVERDCTVAGGNVTMSAGTKIGRDLVLSGGLAVLAATVARDVLARGGRLEVTDQAHITRNLIATVGRPQIASGAFIGGRRDISPGPRMRWRGMWAGWQLFRGLALLLTGMIFVAAAPRLTAQAESVLRAHPWGSLLAGFLILLVTPLAILVVLFTIIGIPLAVITLWGYLTLIFLSPVIVAVLAGRLVLRQADANIYASLIIGVLIYIILRLIPILSGVVGLLALLFGMGALILALQGRTARPLFPSSETAPPAAA